MASSSVFFPKVFFLFFSCLDHFLCEWWPLLPYRPRYWCSPNLNVFLMQGILVLLAWWLFFMEQLKSICALKIRQRIIRQDMLHVHVKHKTREYKVMTAISIWSDIHIRAIQLRSSQFILAPLSVVWNSQRLFELVSIGRTARPSGQPTRGDVCTLSVKIEGLNWLVWEDRQTGRQEGPLVGQTEHLEMWWFPLDLQQFFL